MQITSVFMTKTLVLKIIEWLEKIDKFIKLIESITLFSFLSQDGFLIKLPLIEHPHIFVSSF